MAALDTSTAAPRAKRRAKAATTDILGHTDQKPEIDPKWRHHFNVLLDLRKHLRLQKRNRKEEVTEFSTKLQREQADVATNSYDRDWALAVLSSDQNALYEIHDALSRIRAGTYGVCQLTGKLIPEERLKAIPWTRFTAEAERQLEQRGELASTKLELGKRRRLPREERPESYGTD
jgi:RNA polymerase-binding transcription factor DksA